MKILFTNTIITQALELGFDFEQFDDDTTVQEIATAIFEFFFENSDKLERLEDECEVISNNRNQHVSYGDYESSGEIVDFSEHWHKPADTKVFHSDFVHIDNDGRAKKMCLYYLVGETEYNK